MGYKKNPIEPTLAEAGIDKNLAHQLGASNDVTSGRGVYIWLSGAVAADLINFRFAARPNPTESSIPPSPSIPARYGL